MNAPRSCRVAAAALVATLASVSYAFAQNTRWSPDRPSQQASGVVQAHATAQAGMHSSAVRRTNYQSDSPSWQRSPSGTTSPRDSQTLTRRSPSSSGSQQATYSTGGGTQYTASAGSRRTSSTSYSDQKLLSDYNIRLADGEKLVGPPKFVEGGPVGGSQPGAGAPNVHRSETLPTPDSAISGGEYAHEGMPHEGETIYEGGMTPEGEIHLDPGMEFENGVSYGHGAHGGCTSCTDGGPCLQDDWCDPPACPECGLYGHHRLGCVHVARCLYNCLGFLFKEASIFAGTQAYKGPLDLGINGNFGFNEGFNLAGSIVPFPRYGLGYQVGARWTQSDLSGSVFGSSAREQVFVTAGVFHRAYRGCGLQWGLVYDWMTDNYYTKSTVAQVRGEISLINARGHELGFAGTFGTLNDAVTFNIFNINVVDAPISPTDMYTMFYRHTTRYGGQGRFWGGFTDQNLPILGADFRVPMSNRCDLVGGFNYLMPDAGQNNNGFQDESWNLGMNIVFYFGRMKQGIHNTPYRPLFNVADNGNVMLRQQQ